MTNIPAPTNRLIRNWLPLAVLILANLLIGLLVVRDYGISIDEPFIYKYAANSLTNYTRVLHGSLPVDFNNRNLDFYGPAFFMAARLFSRLGLHLPLNWGVWDAWHFSYFLAFQVAIVALYAICRRWMSTLAAMGAVLLFETQPLLWGHAFINPKDIPFMAAFLASIATGFWMVDRIAVLPAFPEMRSSAGSGLRMRGTTVLRAFASQALKGMTQPSLLLAAALLGLTTSVRVLGPYAGLLVIMYALFRCTRRAPGLIVPYFLVAALVSYLTWPFLWVHPLANLATSLSTMSDYPWNHRVLFQGQLIFARDLPAYFIPKLMLLQFTESALLLFLIGLGVGLWNGLRKKLWEPLALFVLWFLLPLVAIIAQNSIIYDNFRQVLFLVPPLFLLAGLAFDWLFARLKSIYFRAGILILAVLPGIISIVALHPYEYVYYNALTRGVAGAFRQYEMDYWGTAYREAALFVNQVASPDATVIIYEPFASFEPYARPNMKLIAEEQATQITSAGSSPAYDLAVISSRYNFDIRRCPAQPAIKTIERQGAILAVVKKIKPGTTDCP